MLRCLFIPFTFMKMQMSHKSDTRSVLTFYAATASNQISLTLSLSGTLPWKRLCKLGESQRSLFTRDDSWTLCSRLPPLWSRSGRSPRSRRALSSRWPPWTPILKWFLQFLMFVSENRIALTLQTASHTLSARPSCEYKPRLWCIKNVFYEDKLNVIIIMCDQN